MSVLTNFGDLTATCTQEAPHPDERTLFTDLASLCDGSGAPPPVGGRPAGVQAATGLRAVARYSDGSTPYDLRNARMKLLRFA